MLRTGRVGLLTALFASACATTSRPQVQAELNWTFPPGPAGTVDAGIPAGPPKLVFAGNRVLANDVYLAVLGLKEFTADAETAAHIQRTLRKFLWDAGYELASVHCIAHENQIDIGINEGRLEKIVYRGRLSVQSLQFTFALELPHEVFNRPELERQVAIMEQKLGIEKIWFVLVPTVQLTHVGPQLERLPEIRGLELLHEREPWELHFFFAESAWGNGFGLDLRSSYLDGAEIGVSYMKESLFMKDDRFRIAASGGIGLRNKISDNSIYAFFSRTFFDIRWYSAPIVSDVRPAIILKGDLIARQQVDKLIQLENFWAAYGSATFNLSAVPRPGVTIAVGAGVHWRRIWGFEKSEKVSVVPPTVKFSEQVRAFFEGSLNLVFDPNNNRTDRYHLFVAEAVTFAPGSVFREAKLNDPWFGSVHFHYQNPIQFGWHDLWIRVRGRSLFGDVSFFDEDSVAEYNHGIFGANYIRRGVSAEVEFRLSITRDLFKISIFHSIFAFGEVTDRGGYFINPVTGMVVPVPNYDETPRLGTAIGPGFHALIQGMFQLDIYGSFGVLSNGKLAANATLNLNKVF